MKIALTVHTSDKEPARDMIRTPYVPYVFRLGYTPVLLPNNLPDVTGYLDAVGIEAVLLTGGGDLHPARYKQSNTHSQDVSIDRDRTEWALLDAAVERGLPVLGICRGFQVLNVYFGGGLIQDIPTGLHTPTQHNIEGETHLVMITDPRIEAVLGEQEVIVNSHHHQGVTRDILAPGFEVFAISPSDDIVEGMIHSEYPIMGVQWHPERPDCPSCKHDIPLFRQLFDTGAFWQQME